MIRNILALLITQFTLLGVIFASCEIDPFPPYPPSPPEFQRLVG